MCVKCGFGALVYLFSSTPSACESWLQGSSCVPSEPWLCTFSGMNAMPPQDAIMHFTHDDQLYNGLLLSMHYGKCRTQWFWRLMHACLHCFGSGHSFCDCVLEVSQLYGSETLNCCSAPLSTWAVGAVYQGCKFSSTQWTNHNDNGWKLLERNMLFLTC